MGVILICVTILFTITDVAYGKYQRVSHGWVSKHKVMATWDEAYERCRHEGAVLASPTTQELRDDMLSLMDSDRLYYTGISARYSNLIFESVDGVLVDDMPVSDMFEQLNPDEGRCLAMNSKCIKVVPCTSRLPYICYRKKSNATLTECGTYDKGYKYFKETGSCYKYYYNYYRNYNYGYARCVADGGYLVILDNYTEALFVSQQIISVKDFPVVTGVVSWTDNGEFTSIRGYEFPYDNQYNGWTSGVQANEIHNCVTLDFVNIKISPRKNCLTEVFFVLGFVCEKDPSFLMYPENST